MLLMKTVICLKLNFTRNQKLSFVWLIVWKITYPGSFIAYNEHGDAISLTSFIFTVVLCEWQLHIHLSTNLLEFDNCKNYEFNCEFLISVTCLHGEIWAHKLYINHHDMYAFFSVSHFKVCTQSLYYQGRWFCGLFIVQAAEVHRTSLVSKFLFTLWLALKGPGFAGPFTKNKLYNNILQLYRWLL